MARMLAVIACVIPLLVLQSSGQGLEKDSDAALGAANAYSQLDSVYKNARAWRNRYASSASVCSQSQGSLCASRGLNGDQQASFGATYAGLH